MKAGDFTDSIRTARLKCGGLFLRHLVDVAKHLARAREVKATIGPQLPQRRKHVVRAVDVRAHRRKAVSEAFRHKALGREVITLVKIVFAEDVENAGVTLETGRVQRDTVQQVSEPAEPRFGGFQGHATDQAVHLVAQTKEIICEVTAILTGYSSNQRSLGQRVILLYRPMRPILIGEDITKISPCLRSGEVLLKMAVL